MVWTGDGRVYFYNPSTRTSVWDRPEELFNKAEVDKALNKLPDQLLGVDKLENKAGKLGKDIAESDEGSNDKAGKKRSETESSENELDNEEVPSKKLRADVSIGKCSMKVTRFHKYLLRIVAAIKPYEMHRKTGDIGKEAAIEAEVKASRERALVPLDVRVKSFKEMLKEKDVSNL